MESNSANSSAGTTTMNGNAGGVVVPSSMISSTTTTTTGSKWVTRELAALDFLLNIPLENERQIVNDGWNKLKIQQSQHLQDNDDDSSTNHHPSDSESGKPTKSTADRYSYNTELPTPKGTWWEKWITDNDGAVNDNNMLWNRSVPFDNNDILENPTRADIDDHLHHDQDTPNNNNKNNVTSTKNSVSNPIVPTTTTTTTTPFYAPGGRRLDGDDAVYIRIPFESYTTVLKSTMQKDIAKQAAVRQWEIQIAHGLTPASSSPTTPTSTTTMLTPAVVSSVARTPNSNNKQQQQVQQQKQQPLLDGRIFFSSNNSYPLSVFSMIRYEPRREEAAFRRRKLEAIGGGGSQFAMPVRDWRGISYRALLPRRVENNDKKFNRFLRRRTRQIPLDGDNSENNNNKKSPNDIESFTSSSSSSSSSSDDDSSTDGYVPGLLDDPDMVQGRHRNIMIGDHITGPVVASTIQFVEPTLLKAELNKQFRDRFDGWEPPKAARKYIGARVINGNYVLMDPVNDDAENYPGSSNNSVTDDQSSFDQNQQQKKRSKRRPRQHSVTSLESANESSVGGAGGPTATTTLSAKEKLIRMPPSLTLSKIRSLKAQALRAAVAANVEISTVALACVYFERLCLDCRVDKSNRRLTFAACLLLAAKLNECNVGLVMKQQPTKSSTKDGDETGSEDEGKPQRKVNRLQSLIRPTKRGSTMFASLLQFFATDWSLSLKHLFDAEWGVFAALGFSLTSNPTHIAFHYKRLMKALEKNPIDYLGREMYQQWQDVLADEDDRRTKRERKMEARRKKKEERILNMHIEIENEVLRRKGRIPQSIGTTGNNNNNDKKTTAATSDTNETIDADTTERLSNGITEHHKNDNDEALNTMENGAAGISSSSGHFPFTSSSSSPGVKHSFSTSAISFGSNTNNNIAKSTDRRGSSTIKGFGERMNFLHRFGLRRSISQDRLSALGVVSATTNNSFEGLQTASAIKFHSENNTTATAVGTTSPSVASTSSSKRPLLLLKRVSFDDEAIGNAQETPTSPLSLSRIRPSPSLPDLTQPSEHWHV